MEFEMKKFSRISVLAMVVCLLFLSACNTGGKGAANNPIVSIEFSGHGFLEMISGEQSRLEINVIPGNYTDTVIISTTSDCVSVDEEWRVTALSPGTAVVKAKAKNGTASDECIIKVKENGTVQGSALRNPDDVHGFIWAPIDLGYGFPVR